MLDIDSPLPVPGADVIAYADLDSADVVWAFPAAPRLAEASDGGPDAALMLYRRGAQGPVEGGQLTLAIDLRLTSAETAAVTAAATDRRGVLAPGQEPPPPPSVRPPQWTEGTAAVDVAPGMTLNGRPSLIDVNHCVLVLQVPPERAGDVQKAWEDGFPDAVATMDLTAEAGSSAGAAAAATGAVHGPGLSAQYTVGVGARATRSSPLALHLQGPLRLPASARTTRRTELTL
jgi:hypothetical protein